MKVLWYVNIIMPAAAKALGMNVPNIGGWLTGAAEALRQTDVELSVVTVTAQVRETTCVQVDGVAYFLLPVREFDDEMEKTIEALRPDLVHIFGTEYRYNTQLVHLCKRMDIRHVVTLQGVMYQCAAHYDDGLPAGFRNVNPIVKLMRKFYYADSIALEKQRFAAQGQLEIEALKEADAVIGRTAWDKASALAVNPQLHYYHVNENLRDAFYTEEQWQYSSCEPHTIFISQSFYPIKGFHMLLEALPELVKHYPDIKVVVGGQTPYTLHHAVLDKVVDYFFEYQKYSKQLIRENRLQSYIHYTGSLDAEQMKAQFLKCNVFLSCSTIENSPNSVGEAMLLGVPVVSSNVGGVASMLSDGEDGILYDFYDKAAMVNAISKLFDNMELAKELGASARAHALRTHDREENTRALLNVYSNILADS